MQFSPKVFDKDRVRSVSYTHLDSQRTEGYIDYSSEFYLKGVSNGDNGYDGISRDWRVVSGGTDNLTGDFAVSYDFEIVKRGTLESIDEMCIRDSHKT